MRFEPRFILLSVLLALGLPCASARAAEPSSVGKFGFWTAYVVREHDQPVCYMSITSRVPPTKTPGKKDIRRGEIALMVTHRPAENSSDVISYTAGMKFKPASEVMINIGKKKFSLFTQGDTAWSRDSATDHALATAMRGSASMTVTGVSAKGMKLAETVFLKGADSAYHAIGKACGLPVTELPKAAAPRTKTTPKKPAPQKHK